MLRNTSELLALEETPGVTPVLWGVVGAMVKMFHGQQLDGQRGHSLIVADDKSMTGWSVWSSQHASDPLVGLGQTFLLPQVTRRPAPAATQWTASQRPSS